MGAEVRGVVGKGAGKGIGTEVGKGLGTLADKGIGTLAEPAQRQEEEQGLGTRAKQRHGQLLRTTKCKLWVSRGEPKLLLLLLFGHVTRRRFANKKRDKK